MAGCPSAASSRFLPFQEGQTGCNILPFLSAQAGVHFITFLIRWSLSMESQRLFEHSIFLSPFKSNCHLIYETKLIFYQTPFDSEGVHKR